jgi:alkylation response protein AidB-like acyl-CoA dehydrogenase
VTPARAFALDSSQERLQAEVRTLARETLAPLAMQGPPGRVNRKLVRALGERGLLARLLPPGAASAMELCLLREALAMESTGAETALALQGLGGHPIATAGTQAARRRWLPALVAGEAVAAFAKLYATEAAQAVVDQAVQVHGASALERGHLLEHLYREVRAPRIYEGTSEIQRSVIARELPGRRGPG